MTPDRDLEDLWEEHRRRVLDVGYRLLGSLTEAEDVAQDAFTKLMAADRSTIRDVRAWLVTVTSRLCLDRLRSHDHARRAYVGPWLPEPVVGDGDPGPEDRVTLDDSVRMALLVVLERLTPAERTSFVLHDVFSVPFDEIGAIVGRSPQACRQLASRARRRVEAEGPPTQPVDRPEHELVVARFARACDAGDLEELVSVLDPEVVGDFDSGGAVPGAPRTELDGARAVSRQLMRTIAGTGAALTTAYVNGEPGVVVRRAATTVAVLALGVHDGRVDVIHAVGNPAKLAHLGRR